MPRQRPQNAELGSALYRAIQTANTVTLIAHGFHESTGYRDFFEQAPQDVFPPEFLLWQVRPTGILLPIITPFAISTNFTTEIPIQLVTVRDATGRHRVNIEAPDTIQHFMAESPEAERLTVGQAQEIVDACIREAGGFDGTIRAQDKLVDLDIVDSAALEALRDEIVTNQEVGVPSFGFQINPNDLNLDIEMQFFVLRDQVRAKAKKEQV